MNKPLVILFDANPLVNGNKSGVGYYTFNLIQALADAYPEDTKLIGHYFSFLGRKDHIALPKGVNISYKRSRIIPGKILSFTRRLGFQPPLEIFFKSKGDVVLFTNYFSLPSMYKIPRVVAIHDLGYLEVPQYVAEKNRKFITRFVPRAIKTASKIITISEATKQAIMKHYNTPADKFIITPIPPGPKVQSNGFELSSMGIRGKFILFISNLEPRKNIINLAKAYEQLPSTLKQEYQLVLAGGQGWNIEKDMAYIRSLQEKGENILTPGYISDVARAALYETTSLFVLPSHYEGFGMPILEAMDYGVPTAVSDIPVFHEVSRDASAYFNKDDPTSIAAVIRKVLENPALRQQLIDKGNQRLKLYNWHQVAQDLYQQLRVL